jgi:hypothetical protein
VCYVRGSQAGGHLGRRPWEEHGWAGEMGGRRRDLAEEEHGRA